MNSKIGLTILQIANMFYKKSPSSELETATASIRILINNEDPDIYDEIKAEVLLFANAKSDEINACQESAFDYEPVYTDSRTTGVSADKKKQLFQKFIVIAREIFSKFSEDEKLLAWRRLSNLIHYCIQGTLKQE